MTFIHACMTVTMSYFRRDVLKIAAGTGAGAFTNVLYLSKTPSVDRNAGEMCKPRPQTNVSTMSPDCSAAGFLKRRQSP